MKFKITFFVIILSLWNPLLAAYVQKATYEVSFGVFERIGIAEALFEVRDDQTYTIRIEAHTEGLAKALSNNRVETYESHGRVEEGRLVPLKFVKIRKTDAKKRIKIYTFDHPNKKVILENINSDDWQEESYQYYASDDILSLFFNLKHISREPKRQSLYALGGNKKDGKIDVVFIDENESSVVKSALGIESGEFIKVILNEPIFSSRQGELLINLNKDGLCEKALLKDVLLFGDIVGRRLE